MNKFVWEVAQLPTTEYLGWILFAEEKARRGEVGKGNLMAMNEEDVITKLTK